MIKSSILDVIRGRCRTAADEIAKYAAKETSFRLCWLLLSQFLLNLLLLVAARRRMLLRFTHKVVLKVEIGLVLAPICLVSWLFVFLTTFRPRAADERCHAGPETTASFLNTGLLKLHLLLLLSAIIVVFVLMLLGIVLLLALTVGILVVGIACPVDNLLLLFVVLLLLLLLLVLVLLVHLQPLVHCTDIVTGCLGGCRVALTA